MKHIWFAIALLALALGSSAAILFLTGCGPSPDQIREQQRQERIAKNRPYILAVERWEEETKQIGRFQMTPAGFLLDTVTGALYMRTPTGSDWIQCASPLNAYPVNTNSPSSTP